MTTNEFACFGIGAALGVGMAILLAPKSGPETRKVLRSKAGEGTDYLASRATEAKESAAEAIKRGTKTIRQNVENLSAAMDAGVQTYREAVESTP